MDFETIRDEIIIEVGGDSSDTTLQSLIFGFIKSALRRFPRHTRSRFLLATKTVILSSGNYSVALPSGFVRERDVYYMEGGNKIDVGKLSFDDFNQQSNSSALGSPQSGYRIIGSTIEFLRSADADYTIYIECFGEMDDVELTDTFTGDSSVVEILKDLSKFYYYQYEEDNVNADRFMGLAKAGLDKLEADFLSDELPNYVEES